MAISQEQFRQLFTQALVQVYREQVAPPGFLRSFFPEQTNLTRYISVEVQRGTEKVAPDLDRAASDGNANSMTRSTQRVIEPPYYWEYLNATDHYLYDQAIGQQTRTAFRQLVRELSLEQAEIRNKIERAYEKQASDVLLDGIVHLKSGDSIDFKRKADSLIDLPNNANYTDWSSTGFNPRNILDEAGKFLRQSGKVQGSVLNVIMGNEAINAFLNSQFLKDYGDLRRVDFASVNRPQRNAQGGVLHGELSAGPYNFRLWSYPEYYTDTNDNLVPYLNEKKIVVIPEQPQFLMNFAAVPQLISGQGQIPQQGAFYTYDYLNERSQVHEIHTKSAGVAHPVAVDQIFTAKVLP